MAITNPTPATPGNHPDTAAETLNQISARVNNNALVYYSGRTFSIIMEAICYILILSTVVLSLVIDEGFILGKGPCPEGLSMETFCAEGHRNLDKFLYWARIFMAILALFLAIGVIVLRRMRARNRLLYEIKAIINKHKQAQVKK